MDRAGGSRTTRKSGTFMGRVVRSCVVGEARPREEKVFSLGERRPGLVALVGHEGRWVTLGGLVFICTRYPLVDAD